MQTSFIETRKLLLFLVRPLSMAFERFQSIFIVHHHLVNLRHLINMKNDLLLKQLDGPHTTAHHTLQSSTPPSTKDLK